MKTLVIIPTYNEVANIEEVVRRLRASVPSADALVADDGSPDGTGDVADALAAGDPAVHVLHRSTKQGLGDTYLAGFEWGRRRGYEVLVEMDADGSHQPEQLPDLLGALEGGADVVLGSRWVRGGSVINWPRYRMLLSRGANSYARIALGLPLRDATAGYRAYRTTALARLGLAHVASQGYCFQVDLARRAVDARLAVVEVPITFVERAHGDSKMSTAIVLEALWRVTGWGVRARLVGLRRVRSNQQHTTAR